MRLCEYSLPVTAVAGFMSRVSYLSLDKKCDGFQQAWAGDLFDDLEVADICFLGSFLSGRRNSHLPTWSHGTPCSRGSSGGAGSEATQELTEDEFSTRLRIRQGETQRRDACDPTFDQQRKTVASGLKHLFPDDTYSSHFSEGDAPEIGGTYGGRYMSANEDAAAVLRTPSDFVGLPKKI